MGKKFLTDRQVSELAYIDSAAEWSRSLTRLKARGPGDLENAMRVIEREYGIPFSTTWQLRYRRERIKRLGWDVVERIRTAYQAECDRQQRKLAHEVAITAALVGAAHHAVAEAQAVVDAAQAQSRTAQEVAPVEQAEP